jgi:hypothetical protein
MPQAAMMPIAMGAMAATAATSTAAGIYQMTQGAPSMGGQKLELPPELEEQYLAQYKNYLGEIETNIKETRDLIPYIQQRVNYLDQISQAATPPPSVVRQMQDLDAEIAKRFGKDIAKDVQAGLITDQAKTQVQDLQKQIADEMRNQGKQVDESILTDIQEQIRNRMSSASGENLAIDQVRSALINEVKTTGDVMRRDPQVERQLEEQKNQLMADLANRGIDPNSTAGRRAMQEFSQRATETRFSVGEQLAAGRISRLSELSRLVNENVGASDIARSTALSQAGGLQDVFTAQGQARRERLSGVASLIQQPIATALAAGEPERLREQLNLQRAQTSMAGSAQYQTSFAAGLQAQQQALQLQQLPQEFRTRILESRNLALQGYQQLGTQDWSGNTKKLLEQGAVPGYKPRTEPWRERNIMGTKYWTRGGEESWDKPY